MDGLLNSCPLLDYVAEIPGAFQLVDIGCSGGIDRRWRRMGRRLRALGIDPDVEEIARLKAEEKNPFITYLNAFAGIPVDDHLARQRRGKPELARDPSPRLSTPQYAERMRVKHQSAASGKEKRSANLWRDASLADPTAALIVPDYLKSSGIASVDFVKIDVDGKDFEILHSFDRVLDELKILGVGIERGIRRNVPQRRPLHESARI